MIEDQLIKKTTRKIEPHELIAILRSSKFSDIIGVEETRNIDFKEHNYDLKVEKNQFELAKDVAALANSNFSSN